MRNRSTAGAAALYRRLDVTKPDDWRATVSEADRRDPQPNDLLSFGPFSLFAAERLLKKADEPIPLGGRALDILIALVERAGEVVTHKELISTRVAGCDRGGRQSPRSNRGPSEGAW